MHRYTLPVPFEELDHTADAKLRVRGATPEETLARLVLAFASLVTGSVPAEATLGGSSKVVEVEPSELASLGVDVLRELFFELDAHRLVPVACCVERCDAERGARVLVDLGRLDPEKHAEGLVLKAVTYHDARFSCDESEAPEPWCAEVVFDV
jgi:SHS2 domain-containing protein